MADLIIFCIYQTMYERSTNTWHLCCYASKFQCRDLSRRHLIWPNMKFKISRMTSMPLWRPWKSRVSSSKVLAVKDALVSDVATTMQKMVYPIFTYKIWKRPVHISKIPRTSVLKLRTTHNLLLPIWCIQF